MEIFWTLLIGFVVGALAKLFMPGDDPGGVIVTMILGIAGSFVAQLLGRAFGVYTDSTAGIIMSIGGAMLLLVVYRAIRGRHALAHRH